MSLTLQVEQRLEKYGLIAYFAQHINSWRGSAKEAYDYVKKGFPANAQVRTDDIAKALIPIVEVNEGLKAHLALKKAAQKYWYRDFTDLILDRVWDDITNPEGEGDDEAAAT